MANDREHFETYREQTRVKHTILKNYLPQYYTILKGTNKRLVYIDGFAGRGTYTNPAGGEINGSPLLALDMLANTSYLTQLVRCLFIEKDDVLAAQLQASVANFLASNPVVDAPVIRVGDFAPVLLECIEGLERSGGHLAPTFLFADPCGVAGARFNAFERFMQNRSCELLLFFNIDGVRRILGLKDKMGDTLAELLGSNARAEELAGICQACRDPNQREQSIVAYYETLIRNVIGAQFITTFRVEHEERRVTSHYLIHVTRHHLGFRIMKEVMWKVGRTVEGEGGLAFEQASLENMTPLIRPQWQRILAHVEQELTSGPKRASHFYFDLTERPDNRLSHSAYRQALLELEASGRVVVLKKDNSGELAPKRKPNTLAEDYYVRLA